MDKPQAVGGVPVVPTITITWKPPCEVNVTFAENPILCAFMIRQAQKIIDKHFDREVGAIKSASDLAENF